MEHELDEIIECGVISDYHIEITLTAADLQSSTCLLYTSDAADEP